MYVDSGAQLLARFGPIRYARLAIASCFIVAGSALTALAQPSPVAPGSCALYGGSALQTTALRNLPPNEKQACYRLLQSLLRSISGETVPINHIQAAYTYFREPYHLESVLPALIEDLTRAHFDEIRYAAAHPLPAYVPPSPAPNTSQFTVREPINQGIQESRPQVLVQSQEAPRTEGSPTSGGDASTPALELRNAWTQGAQINPEATSTSTVDDSLRSDKPKKTASGSSSGWFSSLSLMEVVIIAFAFIFVLGSCAGVWILVLKRLRRSDIVPMSRSSLRSFNRGNDEKKEEDASILKERPVTGGLSRRPIRQQLAEFNEPAHRTYHTRQGESTLNVVANFLLKSRSTIAQFDPSRSHAIDLYPANCEKIAREPLELKSELQNLLRDFTELIDASKHSNLQPAIESLVSTASKACRAAATAAPDRFASIQERLTPSAVGSVHFPAIEELLTTLSDVVGITSELVRALEQNRKNIETARRKLEAGLSEKETALHTAGRALSELRQQAETAATEKRAASQRMQALTSDLESANQTIRIKDHEIQRYLADFETVGRQRDDANTRLAQAVSALTVTEQHLQHERDTVARMENEIEQLQQRKGQLEERLAAEQESLPQALLTGPLAEHLDAAGRLAPAEVRFVLGVARAIYACKHGIADETQIATLIHLLGRQLFSLLRKLKIPPKERRRIGQQFADFVATLVPEDVILTIYVPFVGDPVDDSMTRQGRGHIVEDILNWGIRNRTTIERRAQVG